MANAKLAVPVRNLAEVRAVNAVDKLGHIKAQMAELKQVHDDQVELVKQLSEELNVESIDGQLFRASISHALRSTLDMEAVKAKLTPQFIAAHTTVTPVVTVKVVARKTS